MNQVHSTQRTQHNAALALFERELAFYRADAQHYLSVEKSAERCARLSALLAAAALVQSRGDEIDATFVR